MAALFPIEPIIQAVEEDERAIEMLIELDDSLSIDTALFIADQTINTLIRNITRRIFTSEEKRIIAEHLTALGIVAIGRTDDILYTLTHAREIDAETLIEKLCEMRLAFAASECDEADWIGNLENEFPSGEDADADR